MPTLLDEEFALSLGEMPLLPWPPLPLFREEALLTGLWEGTTSELLFLARGTGGFLSSLHSLLLLRVKLGGLLISFLKCLASRFSRTLSASLNYCKVTAYSGLSITAFALSKACCNDF